MKVWILSIWSPFWNAGAQAAKSNFQVPAKLFLKLPPCQYVRNVQGRWMPPCIQGVWEGTRGDWGERFGCSHQEKKKKLRTWKEGGWWGLKKKWLVQWALDKKMRKGKGEKQRERCSSKHLPWEVLLQASQASHGTLLSQATRYGGEGEGSNHTQHHA